MNLVEVKGDNVYCDSSMIAKKFGVKHAYVINNCDKLISDLSKIKGGNYRPLIIKEDRSYRGNDYTAYLMDRNFFSLLCMRFRGINALEWQIKFNDAFYKMEKELIKKADGVEWKQARLQSKASRKSFTDVVKDFTEYAVSQGSTSTRRYYGNITRMEYAALELTQQHKDAKEKKSNLRDLLDCIDLSFLSSAEHVAELALKQGMESEMHYKDIFKLAKERVIIYAEAIKLPRLTNKL